jgi:ATP-dependent Clp protease, protease subunit
MGNGFRINAKGNAVADILIYEDVGASWFGGVSAKDFATQLKDLGKVEQLNIRINSYGGDVFDGLAIYRQLADHKAKKIVHIDGVAASIASIIAMAGEEIRIAEAGFLMIHDAWGMAVGDATTLRDMASLLEATTSSLTDIYIARTKKEPAQVRSWMMKETWFNATEAVANGFATSVTENVRMAAHYDPDKHPYRHPPADLVGRPLRDAQAKAIERLMARRNQERIAADYGAKT